METFYKSEVQNKDNQGVKGQQEFQADIIQENLGPPNCLHNYWLETTKKIAPLLVGNY